jgi:hypothetical protein
VVRLSPLFLGIVLPQDWLLSAVHGTAHCAFTFVTIGHDLFVIALYWDFIFPSFQSSESA